MRVSISLKGIRGAGDDGESDRAARLPAKAASLREEVGSPLPLRLKTRYESMLETLRTGLGEEAFSRTWSEGQQMQLDRFAAAKLNMLFSV
jgi:hypothetical protein